jgi:N-acetylglucosaminyldiphosphoundecaprenol N-acetyl-beta-D-mannosaminyltransferase
VGHHHGYYSIYEKENLIQTLQKTSPNVVLIGVGFPNQEFFLKALEGVLSTGLGIGIGGALEIIAGLKPRAPQWIQRIGLEWLYRCWIDPKRIRRLGFIPRFVSILFMR